MRVLMAPRSSLPLGVPLHTLAGVQNHRSPRLGGITDIFSAVAGPIGNIVGALFGGSSASSQLSTQRKMAQDQLNAATSIASMQSALGVAQIDAAVKTEQIRAANELAAIDSQYAAALASQRAQKQVAQEALASQLASQTSEGVFGLARSGVEQSASTSRAFPRTAGTTLVLLVLGTAAAVAFMKTGGKSKKRRRRGGGRGRAAPATSDSDMISVGATA